MGVLLLVVLWGGLLAASIRFLYRRARRFFQWRKDTPVPRWKRLMILLPPVCLVFAAAIRLLPQIPGYCPARPWKACGNTSPARFPGAVSRP